MSNVIQLLLLFFILRSSLAAIDKCSKKLDVRIKGKQYAGSLEMCWCPSNSKYCQWWPVCGYWNWNNYRAGLVCRQLNFTDHSNQGIFKSHMNVDLIKVIYMFHFIDTEHLAYTVRCLNSSCSALWLRCLNLTFCQQGSISKCSYQAAVVCGKYYNLTSMDGYELYIKGACRIFPLKKHHS